jgi:formate hydrogenlyase subunit 4
LAVLLSLVANLSLPWGIALTPDPSSVLIGVVAVIAKTAVLGVVLAAAEVFLAKLRLFRVPELLAGSFVLAFLAVTGSFVIG